MRINSFQNNKGYNLNIKKESSGQDVSKSSFLENVNAPKKVAFYGLFDKKPIYAKRLFAPIELQAGEQYLVSSDSILMLGNNIISLGDEKIKEDIDALPPNKKMIIGKTYLGLHPVNSFVADKHLCIKKDKNKQILVSAVNNDYSTKLMPNYVVPPSLNESFVLEPHKYYELPICSALKIGPKIIDLADYKDKITALKNGEFLIAGRDDNADIKIDSNTTSRRHFLIEKRCDRYYVKDLNSLNGTSFQKLTYPDNNVDEFVTLKKNVPTKVKKDSQIYLGHDFAIDLRNKNILNLLQKKGTISVGRSPDADVVVPAFYDKVSRRHLDITLHNDEIYVTDLNSMNDTQIIPKNKVKPFYQGVGKIELKQGNIGDCFMLVNLYALSRNPVGRVYLENMVKIDDDGNYVVSFYNNPPITVPLEQLDGQKYGNTEKVCVAGELGIRAIERAYGKKLNNFHDYDKTLMMEIDNGGKILGALWDLTGISGQAYRTTSINIGQKLEELSKIPMDNQVLFCSSYNEERYGRYVDPQQQFNKNHAYAIKSIDNNNRLVEVINPHNTKKSYWVPFYEFSEIFDYLYVVEM